MASPYANAATRTAVLGCALAAGACWQSASAQSQTPTQPSAKTYTVTTLSQSGAGNSVMNETLSLAPDGSRYRLNIANADGARVSVPIQFAADGTLATDSQDAAITCYNMAMSVIAHDQKPAAADPAAVFVLFGRSVVRIPLDVRATRTQGSARTLTLVGQSTGVYSAGDTSVQAGITINATVGENDGDLHDATFDELHYLGTSAHVVGHTTCALQREEPHATAQT